MRTMSLLFGVALFFAMIVTCSAFVINHSNIGKVRSQTALFSHHAQKKIVKKKMDRRPKKKRLSDIGRTTVNTGKCITKIADLPPEYLFLKPEDVDAAMAEMKSFLIHGDPSLEWYAVEDEVVPFLPQNLEPPAGGVPKVIVPPYVRSRSLK